MADFDAWKPEVRDETEHFARVSLVDAPTITRKNILALYERLWGLGLRPLEADQWAGFDLICEKVGPPSS